MRGDHEEHQGRERYMYKAQQAHQASGVVLPPERARERPIGGEFRELLPTGGLPSPILNSLFLFVLSTGRRLSRGNPRLPGRSHARRSRSSAAEQAPACNQYACQTRYTCQAWPGPVLTGMLDYHQYRALAEGSPDLAASSAVSSQG
jgi:hypothetical protein